MESAAGRQIQNVAILNQFLRQIFVNAIFLNQFLRQIFYINFYKNCFLNFKIWCKKAKYMV